ncbi:unnamed protein product [Adineta steineri]|uniref:Uncharacterized protein n=1 Tax=Adineta steineri TaxID=433720 RepID=A0A815X088_9BILA|nr:unnamed protein product [Adineta steineri]CAF1661276.1 unnamed protein product [Adineta steineri]
MASLVLYFLGQPETRAFLTLFLSIIILPLSAFSAPLIPHFIWTLVRSSYLFIGLYIVAVCCLVRWIARGGQYDALKTKDLSGKTYLITGSAGGIGKQTALELSKLGAKVVLFARPGNLQQTINDVKKVARDPKLVSGYPIDLSDLLSIKTGIEQYKSSEGEDAPITALINNAGVAACPHSLTKDGFEMQMGTNHFGHFYLTKLLLPQLLKSKSRVVNVSSLAHVMQQVACTPETYAQQVNKQTYKPWNAYSMSKTANIYFTQELHRRFGAQGLKAYVLHPGGVDTGLARHLFFSQLLFAPLRMLLFKTQLEGAQTNLFCAVSDDVISGKYYSDCHETELGNPHALNSERAREWWEYSEKMVSEKIKERQ